MRLSPETAATRGDTASSWQSRQCRELGWRCVPYTASSKLAGQGGRPLMDLAPLTRKPRSRLPPPPCWRSGVDCSTPLPYHALWRAANAAFIRLLAPAPGFDVENALAPLQAPWTAKRLSGCSVLAAVQCMAADQGCTDSACSAAGASASQRSASRIDLAYGHSRMERLRQRHRQRAYFAGQCLSCVACRRLQPC